MGSTETATDQTFRNTSTPNLFSLRERTIIGKLIQITLLFFFSFYWLASKIIKSLAQPAVLAPSSQEQSSNPAAMSLALTATRFHQQQHGVNKSTIYKLRLLLHKQRKQLTNANPQNLSKPSPNPSPEPSPTTPATSPPPPNSHPSLKKPPQKFPFLYEAWSTVLASARWATRSITPRTRQSGRWTWIWRAVCTWRRRRPRWWGSRVES